MDKEKLVLKKQLTKVALVKNNPPEDEPPEGTVWKGFLSVQDGALWVEFVPVVEAAE